MLKNILKGSFLITMLFGFNTFVNAEEPFDINECLKQDKCVLESDVVLDSKAVFTKNLTIDLNGYNFSANTNNIKFPNAMLEAKGSTLTIMDSKGGGKLSSPKGYGLYASDGGKLVLNSGTVESLYSPFTGNNTTGDMNFEINGGTLKALEGPAIYMPGQVNLEINGGTLYGGLLLRMGQVTINGGVIDNSNPLNIDTISQYYSHNGLIYTSDAIALWGGTYTSNSEYGNSFDLIINGGTIKSTVGDGITLYALGKEKQDINVEINGGSISGLNKVIAIQTPETLNIDNTAYKKYNNVPTVKVNKGTFSSSVDSSFISNTSKIEKHNDQYVVSLNKTISTANSDVEGTFESTEALPTNHKLSVEKITLKDEKQVQKQAEKLINNVLVDSNVSIKKSEIIATYDISVLNETGQVVKMENGNFKVSLNLGNELLSKYKNFKVAYIDDNGNVKEVFDAIVKDGIITFEISHLSTYSIIGYNTEELASIENPETSDNVVLYLLLSMLSLVVLVSTVLKIKKTA